MFKTNESDTYHTIVAITDEQCRTGSTYFNYYYTIIIKFKKVIKYLVQILLQNKL